MFVDEFYTEKDGRWIIRADQASRFAKEVAEDFNPIHDPDSRRFCVPGDLLFALVLGRIGLYQQMSFSFSTMVGNEVPLVLDSAQEGLFRIRDEMGKECLDVRFSGNATNDPEIVENFTRQYVAFSGRNFPHYLHPLFEEHGVMFHPQRPLVIYDRMDFDFTSVALKGTGLVFDGASMDVERRRAVVILKFKFTDETKTVGYGSKKMIVSGLRPYDATVMNGVVEEFCRLKDSYERPASLS